MPRKLEQRKERCPGLCLALGLHTILAMLDIDAALTILPCPRHPSKLAGDTEGSGFNVLNQSFGSRMELPEDPHSYE